MGTRLMGNKTFYQDRIFQKEIKYADLSQIILKGFQIKLDLILIN